MAMGPTYEQPFWITNNGQLSINKAVSASYFAANDSGANNAALAANSANGANNDVTLPATAAQNGWLRVMTSANTYIYIPYWV